MINTYYAVPYSSNKDAFTFAPKQFRIRNFYPRVDEDGIPSFKNLLETLERKFSAYFEVPPTKFYLINDYNFNTIEEVMGELNQIQHEKVLSILIPKLAWSDIRNNLGD